MAAVTVSIALQFGADLETIRGALTKDHDGRPATLLGAALDALLARVGGIAMRATPLALCDWMDAKKARPRKPRECARVKWRLHLGCRPRASRIIPIRKWFWWQYAKRRGKAGDIITRRRFV